MLTQQIIFAILFLIGLFCLIKSISYLYTTNSIDKYEKKSDVSDNTCDSCYAPIMI